MVEKPSQPQGCFDDSTGQWRLAIAWICELSDGRALLVHPGAMSDGASIPPILWPFVGPRYAAKTFPAAFCHDMLYQSELTTRAQADAEFRRILQMFGVSRAKATAYWIAVRAFGWMVWAGHDASTVAASRVWCELVDDAG